MLAPLTVPEALWRSPDMLDALAERDIAQVFRLVQRQTRVGQTHLGVATGLSQAQVSEIISGSRHVSSIDVLNRIADGLHIPHQGRLALFLGEREAPDVADHGLTVNGSYADVTAIYASRSEFTSHMPPHALFDSASDIRAAGLSLNLLCQQYADHRLRHLVTNGGQVRLLFLDPAGSAIRGREIEERFDPGHLGSLTTLNLQSILRIRDRLPGELADRMQVATYDQTIRFNLTLIDRRLCIAQPYLPHSRGVESPTMVIENRNRPDGLYPVFEQIFTELWEGAQRR